MASSQTQRELDDQLLTLALGSHNQRVLQRLQDAPHATKHGGLFDGFNLLHCAALRGNDQLAHALLATHPELANAKNAKGEAARRHCARQGARSTLLAHRLRRGVGSAHALYRHSTGLGPGSATAAAEDDDTVAARDRCALVHGVAATAYSGRAAPCLAALRRLLPSLNRPLFAKLLWVPCSMGMRERTRSCSFSPVPES